MLATRLVFSTLNRRPSPVAKNRSRAERHLRLLTDHIDKLRTACRETRRHHLFTIDAMVVLPDHLHTIWTLPEGDADLPPAGG
jgi:hypothetical protein